MIGGTKLIPAVLPSSGRSSFATIYPLVEHRTTFRAPIGTTVDALIMSFSSIMEHRGAPVTDSAFRSQIWMSRSRDWSRSGASGGLLSNCERQSGAYADREFRELSWR